MLKAIFAVFSVALLVVAFPLSAQQGNDSEPSDGAAEEDKRIYKSRDEQGNVIFTDDPERVDGEVEEVEVEDPNALPLRVPQRATPPSRGKAGVPPELEIDYQVSIQSPGQEQHFHNPSGPIPVEVSVQPSPIEGHALVLRYDGVALEQPEIPWPQNRGRHTLQARVVNAEGKVMATSGERVFFVHRASKLLPPRQ